MPPAYFPLRWESTGDQWWYASPIDWAAANGLYDVVSELLHLDTNLLIKLTSLRRIRRLETVWDDEAQFNDVAKCRSYVARKLLQECETKGGHNSLLRAGYGGWLLYTAASAGDIDFVKDLIYRYPLLVYGEGEYGVTDIFYAAARSKNSDVFRVLLDFSFSPRCCPKTGGKLEEQLDYVTSEFRWEMMNRAIHALAKGGNLEMLSDILGDFTDVLAYRDAQGSTVLHTASARGQVEVVKNIVASSTDIINLKDNQGNTALHVAAYRGYLAVIEILIRVSPLLPSLPNNYGSTFLHMAVSGFRTPGFRRVDKQIELMNQLVVGNIVQMQGIINVRNNDGRTSLHMAIAENIECNLVELLMNVPSINLNIQDCDGMTPLDLVKQQPESASSEIIMKQLISAGGICTCQDYKARNGLVSQLKMQGIGSSPGTSFRIPDSEIFLYTGVENAYEVNYDQLSMQLSSYSGDISQCDSNMKKPASISCTARRLKFLLRWPKKIKEKKTERIELEEDDSLESFSVYRYVRENHIPLRHIYSRSSSLQNNKTISFRGYLPSPRTKLKFTAGLMHGVIKAKPDLTVLSQSPSSPLSGSLVSSPSSMENYKSSDNVEPSCSNERVRRKQNSFNKKMMNEYFCFGAQGLAVEDSNRKQRVFYITSSRNAKWWYSAFHNVTAMVGAGVLSLPFGMAEHGWSPGIAFLVLSWIVTLYALWQMVETHEMVQVI